MHFLHVYNLAFPLPKNLCGYSLTHLQRERKRQGNDKSAKYSLEIRFDSVIVAVFMYNVAENGRIYVGKDGT